MYEMETIGLIGGASGYDMTVELQRRNRSVALVAGKNSDPGLDLANHTLVSDLSDGLAIADFFKSKGVEKVIVATGHQLAYSLAEYLENQGMVSNINLVGSNIAKDKVEFKKALDEINIDTPRYVTVRQDETAPVEKIVREVKLPCVIKSFNDKAPAQLVFTEQELDAGIAEMQQAGSAVLLEEYIKGVECTAAVRCTFTTQTGLAVGVNYVKARDCKLKGFRDFHQRELTAKESSDILKICEKISAHLHLLSLPRFDLIVSEDGRICVLECNSVTVCSNTNPIYESYIKLYLEPNNIQVASIMSDISLDVLTQKMVNKAGLY